MFLKNIHWKTPVLESFLKKIACLKVSNFIKKETPTEVSCCEYYEIFKNRFFTEHLWWSFLATSHLKPTTTMNNTKRSLWNVNFGIQTANLSKCILLNLRTLINFYKKLIWVLHISDNPIYSIHSHICMKASIKSSHER